MKLGGPEWGETDYLLTQGYDAYVKALCTCGCGHFRDECTDPALAMKWEVVKTKHYASAAVQEWRERPENKDLPAGTLVHVRLIGGAVTDEDPSATAAKDIAEMMARHGLTDDQMT